MDAKKIFVVGNSRSGTTMMGRILGRHSSVFTFHELHFFEQLWNPGASPQVLSAEQAEQLAARLLTIQRDGYYTQGDMQLYAQDARAIVQDLPDPVIPPLVFAAFLNYESGLHDKRIPCDHTPRNVFYLPEILDLYPEAHAVNMIRDPRDVLLSQKNRWRRRFLGARGMPFREVLRSWANYHPVTISLLWNSAIQAGGRLADHPRVFNLRFEDLLDNPEEQLRELCASVGLEFELGMLQVPQVGSSHGLDQPDQMGINPSVAGRWQQDNGNEADLAICQWTTRENMVRAGYVPADLRPDLIALGWSGATWPVKTGLALVLNLRRTRSIVEAVKKRIMR